MAKNIISTTGSVIAFAINRDRQLKIDPIISITVNDEELHVLQTRLGNQIRVVLDQSGEKPLEVEAQTEETVTPEVPAAEVEESGAAVEAEDGLPNF